MDRPRKQPVPVGCCFDAGNFGCIMWNGGTRALTGPAPPSLISSNIRRYIRQPQVKVLRLIRRLLIHIHGCTSMCIDAIMHRQLGEPAPTLSCGSAAITCLFTAIAGAEMLREARCLSVLRYGHVQFESVSALSMTGLFDNAARPVLNQESRAADPRIERATSDASDLLRPGTETPKDVVGIP